MLRDGALDAAILGAELPSDPTLRPVFADPVAAGAEFHAEHGFMPVNHLVVARGDLARARPDLLAELLRMLGAAGADLPGRAGLDPALSLALRYCAAQGLLARPLALDEVWAGSPASGLQGDKNATS
jgi:4,5-dihydroxyphthalate decarboxylase